jgi:hypothetical protein
MMEATPKRKNRQRDPKKQQGEQRRRYDIDSNSCTSSESGGISSPSNNLPLHFQQKNQNDGYSSPSHANNDSSSTGSPARSRIIRDTGDPSTPTPTTTIGHIRSPRSKELHGKLSRPRRRGHRSYGNLNINSNFSGSNKSIHMQRVGSGASIGRSDQSIASVDSTSDQSRLSRYTTASKSKVTNGTPTNRSLSRRGASTNSLHGGSGNQQHSFSSNSLFGLMGGSTYSKTAGIDPSTPRSSTNGKQQTADTYEYYHKHHHHPNPQHNESYTTMPTSPYSSSSLPPLPSLRVIASELSLICSLYCRHGIRSVQKPCRRLRRRLLYGALFLAAVVLGLVAWLCYDFYADALDVCTPPPSSHHLPSDFAAFLGSTEGQPYINNSDFDNANDDYPPRPLVEYYVHGRGIGHYARSVAIVEQLNRAGVDVRMFLTRASMWRAMHEDAKIIVDTDVDQQQQQQQHLEEGQNHRRSFVKRGKTTAIAITSLTPDQGFFDSLSHALERISGDCEVSASSGRYPQLVISDGDFPGMIRAELGGIPSVGIAHGQLFSIAQKPKWVQESAQLNGAWNKQGRLNHVSSFFTEWQIATHFCFLESQYTSGTVARAPLRPEVLQMAEARKWARRGKLIPNNIGDKHHNKSANGINTNIPRLPQAERIQELLFTKEKTSVNTATSNNNSTNTMHRKLVICYFRDHNGEHVVQALLDADFDVLLFDTGYTRDMANNPYRYGAKWIVKDQFRDQERKKYITNENEANTDANRLRGLKLSKDMEHDISSNSGNGHKGTTKNDTLTVEGHGFEVHRSQKDGPKSIRVMDRSLFVPLMHVADGVASSAGSQLMSECIYSHMPLLAMYKEDDSEQRLNVELSHHINAPCHRPLVFGNSFESLTFALQSNVTSTAATMYEMKDNHLDMGPVLESFKGFVREVQSSSVSDTYFRNVHLLDSNGNIAKKNNERSSEHTENDMIHQKDSNSVLEEEDPFRGLPDAAAIILEIIKQVVQKG